MRGHEAVRHFRGHQEIGNKVVSRLVQIQARIERTLEALAVEQRNALDALADAYLQSFDEAALLRAEQLTGFRGFSRRSPIKALEHEAHVLRTTIARIEADEHYVRREYLVGPNGELTRELAERESMLEPWQKECAKFEDLPGFMDLLEVKYDTPHFQESWWQPRYWTHWAQGDAVCEALGLGDFGDDVLPAYEKVRGPRDQWRAQVAETVTRIDAIHALVQHHDEAVARIPQLPEIYLQQCQDVLAQFLEHADPSLLDDWLKDAGGDRAILVALRRVAGLKAKADVLEEMRTQGLSPQIHAVTARVAKHRRKELKYGRPKHAYTNLSGRDTDAGFATKAQKMLADAQKLEAQLERIERFDDYAAFDLDQDPELWYVAFTRKAPSRYSPRLRAWYQRHPKATPAWDRDDRDDHDDRGDRDDALVGAAAAFIDRSDSGYLS
ncbi:MAG: hypothetical protein H6737_28680 [Alphaproteobacteria bacterium]|nr:hypothetical protein [Alphaproteobacteria bacterium]